MTSQRRKVSNNRTICRGCQIVTPGVTSVSPILYTHWRQLDGLQNKNDSIHVLSLGPAVSPPPPWPLFLSRETLSSRAQSRAVFASKRRESIGRRFLKTMSVKITLVLYSQVRFLEMRRTWPFICLLRLCRADAKRPVREGPTVRCFRPFPVFFIGRSVE